MIDVGKLLTHVQSEGACLAVFAVNIGDGAVVDSRCGDGTPLDAAAGVVRALFSNDQGARQREWLVLGGDRTYVCHRLKAVPDLAVAAICSNEGNPGLVASLIRRENVSDHDE